MLVVGLPRCHFVLLEVLLGSFSVYKAKMSSMSKTVINIYIHFLSDLIITFQTAALNTFCE